MGVSINENQHAPSITNCKYGLRHRADRKAINIRYINLGFIVLARHGLS